MKKLVRLFDKTVVFLFKMALYVSLFGTFFLLFGIENFALLQFSRTSGVTMLTFAVVGLGMVAAYGRYDIGQRKSKPIINSLAIATFITDAVTFVQLSIMNTNAANNQKFQLANVGMFAIVFIMQMLIITLFTYGGNYVYFRVHRPERCCVVTSNNESLNQLMNGVDHFKLQYKVLHMLDYRDAQVKHFILECDTVFLYDVPVKERTELVEFCYRNSRNVYFSPEISDIVEINARHVILDDISLISAPVKNLSFEQKVCKRLMDIIISLLAIIISSPIWLICALAIKVQDGGHVFFKQKRATKDGNVFEVYKFRTMKEHVENYSVTQDDDRITRLGGFLRKYRIDELPQFLNILKGEMSLVGPRPEMLENVYVYTKEMPEFSYRLRMKAGLTGYAQIAGKYNTSPRYKLVLDLMYIENYSLLRDVKLILQTLIVLFKKDSAEAFIQREGRYKV